MLINATSIRQARPEHVSYRHVERDAHDVLLAENLPVASFLEHDKRQDFDAGLQSPALSAVAAPVKPCAPWVQQGQIVETV